MTKPRDPEALLSAYLGDGMEVLPDRVVDSVLAEIHGTRQLAVFSPWRTRSRSLLIAAAVLVGLALASAAVVGAWRLLQPDPLSLEPRPSLQGVVAPSSTPSEPSASPTSSAVPSLDLTWTKVDLKAGLENVAWLGDRFVLIDGAGAVSTSIDGASWHVLQPGDDPGFAKLLQGAFVSWQDNAIGWWNPEDGPDYGGKPPITARDVLRILEPPAALAETTPFKGRIQSIGIGPRGIVAQVHSDLDWDAWVTKKLGVRSNNAWVKHLKSVDFRDGILRIKVDNGPGLKVVWADEGFELGDYQDGGFEWYSPDGEQWTAVPAVDPTSSDSGAAFPTGFGDVVGVSDGFIARTDAMWHSSDGLTWRKLGTVANGFDGQMLPWMGGALLTDGVGHFDFWTSAGHTELSVAPELRAPSENPNAIVGTGPLGLVSILPGDKEALVTRDGVDWKVQPIPDEMAAFSGRQRRGPTIAVGERSVLFSSWSGSDEQGYVPSLWVGSLAP